MQKPPPLIDPKTGAVSVVLVSYHLNRLHGEWHGDPPPEGFPFPLRTDVQPSIFTFRPGQSLEEIAGSTPLEINEETGYQSLHAYARTRFGWAHWVFFGCRHGGLRSLTLFGLQVDGDEPTLAASAEVMACLGKYDEDLHTTWFQIRTARGSEKVDGHTWIRKWGKVSVFLDPRDRDPCLAVEWRV